MLAELRAAETEDEGRQSGLIATWGEGLGKPLLLGQGRTELRFGEEVCPRGTWQ